MADKPVKRPPTLEDLGFEQRPMVRWLDPIELIQTGLRTGISTIFGEFADKRELQQALVKDDDYVFPSYGQGDLWLDFVADTGDPEDEAADHREGADQGDGARCPAQGQHGRPEGEPRHDDHVERAGDRLAVAQLGSHRAGAQPGDRAGQDRQCSRQAAAITAACRPAQWIRPTGRLSSRAVRPAASSWAWSATRVVANSPSGTGSSNSRDAT